MFVDSHCHLNLIDYTALGMDREAVIKAALSQKIEHILCVGTNEKENLEVIDLARQYPFISASVGFHPNEIVAEEPTFETLKALAERPKVIAIGETGLDYYRSKENEPWQQKRFETHIAVAKATYKPLIVHTRSAREDTIAILKNEKADTCGGVLHCFTEDWAMAKRALDLNFYISFSGIVTFKNAVELQDVAKKVPLDRILIETDAPWLAPIPYRGKINQPAYVVHVAQFLADLRGIPLETLAKETTQNFYRCMRLTPSNKEAT